MKIRNTGLNIFLAAMVLQVVNVGASDSSGGGGAAAASSSSASSAGSSALTVKSVAPKASWNAQAKFYAFRKFLAQLDDKAKFTDILALSLVVFKHHNARAVLTALQYYITARGLLWGAVHIVPNPKQPTQAVTLVVHKGDAPPASTSVISAGFVGDQYTLSLDRRDLFAGSTFDQLAHAHKYAGPYFVSEVQTQHADGGYISRHADTQALNTKLATQGNNFLSDLVVNDSSQMQIQIVLPRASNEQVLDIYYFTVDATGRMTPVGKLRGLEDPNSAAFKATLLTTFVNMLDEAALVPQLQDLKTKIIKLGQNPEKTSLEKAIPVLETVLARLNKLNDNPLDENKLAAIHLLATVYNLNGQKGLAKEILGRVPALDALAKIVALSAKLNGAAS